MARNIRTDETDASVTIRIVDSETGAPEEGVTDATAGLALWYRKGTTGAKTAISPSDLSALTDAHSDGGILHVDDGYFRLDLPDAAVPDSAGEATVIGGTATDMIVIGVELVGVTDLNAAEVNAEADTALTDYDPPTKTEMDAGFAALNDLSSAEVTTAASAATPTVTVSGSCSYAGSVATSGDVEIVRGDGYQASDGTEHTWTDSAGAWPDISSATSPVFTIRYPDGTELTYTGEIVSGTQVRVEQTGVQTTALTKGRHAGSFIVTMPSGEQKTIIRMAVSVVDHAG